MENSNITTLHEYERNIEYLKINIKHGGLVKINEDMLNLFAYYLHIISFRGQGLARRKVLPKTNFERCRLSRARTTHCSKVARKYGM